MGYNGNAMIVRIDIRLVEPLTIPLIHFVLFQKSIVQLLRKEIVTKQTTQATAISAHQVNVFQFQN